jgi:hypothetical protein
MKKAFVCSLALAALGALSPLIAETVYVPVEAAGIAGNVSGTQLQISNFEGGKRSFTARFLSIESSSTTDAAEARHSAAVPANRALLLDEAVLGGTGLLAVEADPALLIDSWIQSVSRRGVTLIARMPTISSHNRLAAGAVAHLTGLAGDAADLRLVNLGDAACDCRVDILDADGLLTGASAFQVEPRSLLEVAGVAGLGGEHEAQVTCDQPFFAYARVADADTSLVSVIGPTPADQVQDAAAARTRGKDDLPAGTVIFEQNGLLHLATRGREKGVLRVVVPRELRLARLVVDIDVTPGPWHGRNPGGNHAMIWLHRGRFRSNTVANVNAFGPNKHFVKMNQNVDLPPPHNTNRKMNLRLERNRVYHLNYTYNAAANTITTILLTGGAGGGQELKRMGMKGTAMNNTLTIPAAGMVAEFGHFPGQEPPEMESVGWSYLNLKVTMIPKKGRRR